MSPFKLKITLAGTLHRQRETLTFVHYHFLLIVLAFLLFHLLSLILCINITVPPIATN